MIADPGPDFPDGMPAATQLPHLRFQVKEKPLHRHIPQTHNLLWGFLLQLSLQVLQARSACRLLVIGPEVSVH